MNEIRHRWVFLFVAGVVCAVGANVISIDPLITILALCRVNEARFYNRRVHSRKTPNSIFIYDTPLMFDDDFV